MTRKKWLGLSIAAGIASLLIMGLTAITLAQSGVTLTRSPAPPSSISRGMTETFTWTITSGSNTPDRVEFHVLDPDALIVDAQTYTGTAGLSVTRAYTVPSSPKEGRYLGEITYFSVEAGQEAFASVSFYVAERGNLDIFKFDDFNGNGVQDPGDAPVPDVLIRLQTPFGDTVGKLTGADGHANWQDIAIGSYLVTEVVPAGREPTLPPTTTAQVDIDATTYVTFANRIPPSAVTGQTWYDANANGAHDPGETGLPNIAVQLWIDADGSGTLDPGEQLADQVDTGPGGVYTFTLVHAGDYVVVVDATDPDLPAGMGLLDAGQQAVTGLAPGETRTIDFRFDDSGIIGGRIWHDANGNGGIDPGEAALPDVSVCLYEDANANGQVDPGEVLIGCQSSGPSGSYSFTGLPAGDYVVDMDETDPDLPAGYAATTSDPVGITLGAGENLTVNFGLRQPPTPTPAPTATATPTATPIPANSCIIGQKIDDLHVGLPGWTIHARPRDAAEPLLTATTDGSGDFHFAGLTAGWWTVWEEMQPGWAPVTAAVFDAELPVGPQCVEVRFKNRQACALDDYEIDDTPAAATPIETNGIGQKHSLEPPADADWVVFHAAAGGIYTLRTDNLLGSTDTTLTLYDTDGSTPLAYNDDIVPGADPRSLIVWQAPASGQYFARVQDYYQSGARGCLAYDLILTAEILHFVPLIPYPPAPTPTPTPTATPTATFTPTPTPTPTATRTPAFVIQPLVLSGVGHPKGIGVNLNTHRLYVASQDNDTVYIVDPLTAFLLGTVPVGQQPFGVAVNTTTNKIYVANFASNDLSVIDGVTDTVIKTITFAPYGGEPTYVAFNEITNRIYVPLHDGGRLAVIDGATDTLLTTLEVGGGAFGVAVDPLLDHVYVSCRDARLIRVIDGASGAILWGQTAYPGGEPFALGIDPGLGQLYVSFAPNPGDPAQPNQVLAYRIPVTGPTLRSTILVGPGGPNGGGGIGVNPVTHHVFVSNSLDDSASLFDGMTLMLLTTVAVGDDPMGVAVDPGLSYAFIGNRGSNTVTSIPDVY